MADVDINGLCIQLRSGKQICLTIAGMDLCAPSHIELGDPGQTLRAFLGQINTALTPLTPFFDVLDVLVKIVECVTAIPDAILAVPPDPSKITDCIPALAKALGKVLGLLPQVWIPKLVKQILVIVILGLEEIRNDLEAMIDYRADLDAAGLVVALPGNIALGVILDCETSNFDIQMENQNESLGPLSRLLGIVALLLKLSGSPVQIPDINNLGPNPEGALAPLDEAIKFLRFAESAIPDL